MNEKSGQFGVHSPEVIFWLESLDGPDGREKDCPNDSLDPIVDLCYAAQCYNRGWIERFCGWTFAISASKQVISAFASLST
jgi:hypothetical protein